MGKAAQAKREALGKDYIGKHGNKNATARGKKARIDRARDRAPVTSKAGKKKAD